MFERLKIVASHFRNPVLLMLCLAGAIRNGAGLVWVYNIVLFFNEYHPEVNVSNVTEMTTILENNVNFAHS